ncbi:Peptidyl-prolyl isomerase cwc27 [Coemansia sp. RSA 486]|nr:Peptidyl-prolyl isomerase cwc27 [Coemansia sp. RSA 486]
MANAGPNDNGSQFFITLASTPELQKKNTMFGVVVGQSLFTALKLGEGETDKATERPVHPRTILSARVLDNPFSDIVPRPKHEQTLQLKDGKPESGSAKRKRIKAVKNKKLLSFADDDSDDDACLYSGSSSKSKDVSGNSTQHTKRRFNMKSSHDLLESDPMLSNQVLASPALLPAASANTKEEKKMAPVQVQGKLEEIASTAPGSDVRSAIEKVENEINRIDGRKGKRVQDPEADGSAPGISSKKASSTALSEMLTQYSANKKNSATLRKKDKGHEDKLLERLSSFQSKIRKTKASSGAVAAVSNEASADKKAKCKLHSISDCKSCQPSEPDEYGHLAAPATESGKNNWLSHKLEFRNSKEKPLASDYAPRVEDYVVIDPREQEQKFLGKSKRSRK